MKCNKLKGNTKYQYEPHTHTKLLSNRTAANMYVMITHIRTVNWCGCERRALSCRKFSDTTLRMAMC